MTTKNAEQIAEWNGVLGERWVSMQRDIDKVVVPFGNAAFQKAAPQPGERVLDVGCGCGDTSIALARSVGKSGAVLGVDVSRPMLDVARSRIASGDLPNLEFREGDASEAALPGNTDLLFSRFGVMFFSEPAEAFRHVRGSMRKGARCVFVCWRAPRDNPWAMAPLAAARAALNVTPPPADPNAPGPFAFADEQRVRDILGAAGFADVELQRFDTMIHLGASPRAAAENTAQLGPVSRFVRESGVEHLPLILDAVERALEPFAAADGHVGLSGSTWIVSARNPG